MTLGRTSARKRKKGVNGLRGLGGSPNFSSCDFVAIFALGKEADASLNLNTKDRNKTECAAASSTTYLELRTFLVACTNLVSEYIVNLREIAGKAAQNSLFTEICE